jgi:aminoglycoside phosphotransferase (APT) family kinase protein
MEVARGHGYPVPEVREVRDDGLVLERVDGPTMMTDCRRRPWRMPEHARTLARLHHELHRIAYGDGVLLHLDLHPKNVLLSARGPAVIDWANARGGEAALDPALTWVILLTSAGAAGRGFAWLFARHIDVRSALNQAVELRVADRNVTAVEARAVRRLVA